MHFFSNLLHRYGLSAAGLLLVLTFTALAGSETTSSSISARRFTLKQALETAFQRNPDILRARQEIRRTKGVQIEVTSQALPHITADSAFDWTEGSLNSGGGSFSSGTALPSATPGATVAPLLAGTGATSTNPATVTSLKPTDYSYFLRFGGSQLLYNGSVIPNIKGAGYSADASLFALRDTIDRVIATVRQQFYQVVLNKELISVQEESVRLLESQLKDQQNRFEAGTVPRFNVLQAEVALSTQQPALITARNNYRVSQLQLAKTIGLDFDPRRGDKAPLECIGELAYIRETFHCQQQSSSERSDDHS